MKATIVITAVILISTLAASLALHFAGDSWSMERMLECLEADLSSGKQLDDSALEGLTREDRQRVIADTAAVRARFQAGAISRPALDPLVDLIEDAYQNGMLSFEELRDLRETLAALAGG